MKRILILFISLFAFTASFSSRLPEDNTNITLTDSSAQTSRYRIYGHHLKEVSTPYGLLIYRQGNGTDEFNKAKAKRYKLLPTSPKNTICR